MAGKNMQRKLAQQFDAVAGPREGNNRQWTVTRKSDGASRTVTVHCICNSTAAIESAIRSGLSADVAAV